MRQSRGLREAKPNYGISSFREECVSERFLEAGTLPSPDVNRLTVNPALFLLPLSWKHLPMLIQIKGDPFCFTSQIH